MPMTIDQRRFDCDRSRRTHAVERSTAGRRLHRAAAAVALATVAAAASVSSAPAQADEQRTDPPDVARDPAVIGEWNEVAMGVLTPSSRPLTTQPFVVAAMHVAMYDAVVSIEGGSRPFFEEVDAPNGASSEAAAAAAAHGVLVGFIPERADVFDAALVDSLADIPDGQAETDGVAVGEAAAEVTLDERLDDGSQSGTAPPPLPPAPGVWAPTPPATVGLAPWLADAEPFAMRSPDQFRPPAPPRIASFRFWRALNEVRRLGGSASTERTPEQTTVARFWGDQPIAQSQRALRGHAEKLDGDIAETARLFAAVLTSQADAFIACWDAKYEYQFWRPWQSVPIAEPGWTPLLPTPNHPEYPSAHGCLTGSTAFALSRVTGTTRIGLDIDAANIGITRHFATRGELLREVGDAWIWGGLHYRFSIDAGLRIARRVVDFSLSRHFRPVSC